MSTESNDYKVAMKAQIGSLFRRFSSTYQNLWVTGTPKETAELMAFWISELSRLDIQPEQVANYGAYITDAPDFRNYPPKPVQFAQFVKDAERREAQNNQLSDDLYDTTHKLCSKWRMIYGSLFCARDELSEISDFWTKEFKASGLTSKLIKKAYYEIRKQSRYKSYPPTVDVFVMTAKLCGAGVNTESLPTAEEAYAQACHSRVLHPVVREARRRVGSYELRTQASSSIRKAFERTYETILQEICNGDLKLEEIDIDIMNETKEEAEKSVTLSSTIDSLLSGIQLK